MAQQSRPASGAPDLLQTLDAALRAVKADEEQRRQTEAAERDRIQQQLDDVDTTEQKLDEISEGLKADLARQRETLRNKLNVLERKPGTSGQQLSDRQFEKLAALLEGKVSLEDALHILEMSETDVRSMFHIPDSTPLSTDLVLTHVVNDHQKAIDELDTRVSDIEPRLDEVERVVGIKPHAPTDHRTHTPPRWDPPQGDKHETHPLGEFEEPHDGPKVLTWKSVGKWAKSLVDNKPNKQSGSDEQTRPSRFV